MSGWILSVTAVICLTVLMDIVMPDGQMNKYVKGITSLIVVFVVVSPLASIFKGEFDFSLKSEEFKNDSVIAARLEAGNIVYDEKACEFAFENLGIDAEISIAVNKGEKKAAIIIAKQVLDEKDMNILITQVTEIVEKIADVKRENIEVEFKE